MDDRAAKLLLKAVRLLPQREQDQVLLGLLRRAPTTEPVPFAGAAPFTSPLPGPLPHDVLMFAPPSAPMEASGPTAMLPVRLPPELHERLRRWSNEHGFSMASVVRGLVERFLDEQGKHRPRRSASGRSRPKGSTARG